MNKTPAQLKTLVTVWTARAAFTSGLIVSLGANIWASADHGVIGIISGVWSPLALLMALFLVENISHKTWSGRFRLAGMVILAGIAAWVSYWHLAQFFTAGGLDDPGAHLMPFTVDVLMALAGPSMKKRPAPAQRKPAARKAANVTPIRKRTSKAATAV
jgi:apolipoprotein N-acyltransferase